MRIIAGEAKGRKIDAPAGTHTRPTLDRVRENIFNMIQYDVPDSRVLDLFSGSGAMSLEAVSRGAAAAVMVDSDRNACAVQKKNADKLGYAEKTRIFHCDWRRALAALKTENNVFDLVFLDPPYVMTDLREVFDGLLPVVDSGSAVVLEYEAGKEISVSERFVQVKNRSWGFCAAAVYRLQSERE